MSTELMLNAAERGPECPACGVPFDEHDGFAAMCGKLQAAARTKATIQRIQHYASGKCAMTAETRLKLINRECECELVESTERQDAASPSWQDRPTGPGLWMMDDESLECWSEESFQRASKYNWLLGRVYGPIPADTKGGE